MMTRIFIIILLIMCFAGAELKETAELPEEEFYSMVNNISYDTMNFTFTESGNNKNNTFIQRVVLKGADFFAFLTVEGVKEAMGYGYEHPQYNYGLAWKLLLISIFAPLIIPLIYVIIFIGYFIIMIKQRIQRGGKIK